MRVLAYRHHLHPNPHRTPPPEAFQTRASLNIDPPPQLTDTAPPVLAEVSHPRELRGAWVASVWNINFPSSPGLSQERQKGELTRILDTLQECGFNAVFLQVRPEGDALYQSELEPWSSSLTGVQGQDPGYDPTRFLVEEARKRNLEVHAWLNPFRAQAASPNLAPPHMALTHPEHVHEYGSYLWMDPGSEEVQARLTQVCQDLVERYDLDGIHFDDYFYPYPNGQDFPDELTWNEYREGGGQLNRADWRRQNVNRAVQTVDEALKAQADHVRFGISPFGLPAPERPEGTWGFDQYHGLYADTQKWMDEGWVDYLAPQLYWPTTKRGQPYETLVDWWNDHSCDGRAIFAGNNLAALGSSNRWTPEEYRLQVELSRRHAGAGGAGNIWWHVGPLLKNQEQVKNLFKNDLYRRPALTPPLPETRGRVVEAPEVTLEGNRLRFRHQDSAPLRAWTIYRKEGEEWKLDRILTAEESECALSNGTWAVAAATRHGLESAGVVHELP